MTSDITVVITTIPQRRALLARAIASVGAQTLLPDTVVIVEDTERLGGARNRQRGLDQVTTQYVAHLDDDDEFLPQHLERLRDTIRETGADLVYPWFTVVGGSDPFPWAYGKPWDDNEPHQVPVTSLALTGALKEAGGWDGDWDVDAATDPGVDSEGNRAGEDYRLILRMIERQMVIHHLPEISWLWHHDSQNTMGLPSRIRP